MSPAAVKETNLHLFRALLRAASYLPDDFARTYIHNHIIDRFRDATAATPNRLKAARSGLNTLHRAAYGEPRPLLHVLQLTYGRTGRRRRELLTAFIRPELMPNTSTCPSEDQARDIGHTIQKEEGKEDPDPFYEGRPMLLPFLKSQRANNPPTNPRGPLLGLKPAIPAENSWSRSLPLNRQRNLRLKWWANTLDRLLPPLPELEWNRLRDLATGVLKFQGPPKRRVRVGVEIQEDRSLLQAAYLKKPIRDAARQEKDRALDVRNRHHLTPRFMRRIWADVWSLTSFMSYDTETKRLTVTWGGGRSAISKGMIPFPGPTDLRLFEGTNDMSAIWMRISPDDGSQLQKPQSQKPRSSMSRPMTKELIRVVEKTRMSTERLGRLIERLSGLIPARIKMG